MTIHINKPYKISALRYKRYNAHYNIVSSEAVVIPLRNLGSEVMCDIRWEDANGNLGVKQNVMFANDNLIPLNPLLDESLLGIWKHFYEASPKISEAGEKILV